MSHNILKLSVISFNVSIMYKITSHRGCICPLCCSAVSSKLLLSESEEGKSFKTKLSNERHVLLPSSVMENYEQLLLSGFNSGYKTAVLGKVRRCR